MIQELISQQIVCKNLGTLQFMYPTFKIVYYENEINEGKPFIYVGDIKYINKIKQRSEPFIIVSFTGTYDLEDRKTLMTLAFNKHNKKIPKYVEPLIDKWSDSMFYYNWKLLFVTGSLDDKEVENHRKFFEIIEHFNKPYLLIKNYLESTDLVENRFFESSMVSFILNSKNITEVNTKNMKSLKLRQSFKNSYSKNVKYAIENIMSSDISLDSLRFLSLLMDLVFGENHG